MSIHEINVVMPRRLTAENGAKALLMGEFFEEYECSYYDEDGELVEYMKKVPVSWDTIKEIYKKIVAHYGTTPKTPNNKMKIFNLDFQKQAGKKFKQKINWIPWPCIHPVAKGVRIELLVRYQNGKVDLDWWDNDEGNWTETIDPSTITHWADIYE